MNLTKEQINALVEIGQKAKELGEMDWLITALQVQCPNSALNNWVSDVLDRVVYKYDKWV